MTRLWTQGEPIAVTSSAGDEPSQFVWRGHAHQVEAIVRAWRVDIDWWRVRVWRAYFRLCTDSGLLVVIYQDLLTGEWYLQRLYD